MCTTNWRLLAGLVAAHLMGTAFAFSLQLPSVSLRKTGNTATRTPSRHPALSRGTAVVFPKASYICVPQLDVARMMSCSGNVDDHSIPNANAYVGPVGEVEAMEAGCFVTNLGLELLIGPSKVAPGRGLFLRVASEEGVDRVVLGEGTLISGYSKTGDWAKGWQGDKAVAFAFDSPDTGVVYDKEFMPLIEAVSIAEGVSENITAGLVGHTIFFDDETDTLKVAPDEHWQGPRYFIPEDPPAPGDSGREWIWGPANLGICANDLAYSPGISAAEYARAAADKNVLQLVWRLHVDELAEALAPSWPVLFLQRAVAFANAEPMEVGISYGHRYWQSREALDL